MTRPGPAIAWIAGLGTVLLVLVFWWASEQDWLFLYRSWADGALKFGLWVVLPVVALLTTGRGPSVAAKSLRLDRAPGAGLTFGLLATLPMAAALFVSPSRPWNAGAIAGNAILGPLAEEVLFRGVLFLGLRAAGWRLWSSLALSALVFALAHELDVQGLALEVWWRSWTGWGALLSPELLSAFGARTLMFAAGGVLFGWLVHRFDSLWPAIGLHAFINLWWQLHLGPAVPLAAAIDWMAVAHGVSVLLAVVLTLRQTRPEGSQSSITD